MDVGFFFKWSRGIYLLNRALQTEYIGAGVEAFNGDIVRKAVLLEKEHQVRFVLNSGKTLIFDLFHKVWTVLDTPAAVDACIQDGDYCWIDVSGRVFREVDQVAKKTTMQVKTGWLNISPVRQAEQHIWWISLLGILDSAFTVDLHRHFQVKPFQTIKVAAKAKRQQLRIKPKIGRMEALQVAIYQAADADEHLSLSKMALVAGSADRLLGILDTE